MLNKTINVTAPDNGNRETVFEERSDGTILCTYRLTDNTSITHAGVFLVSEIAVAWDEDEDALAAVKAANPTVDTAAFVAALTLVQTAIKAYGDNKVGFSP